MHGCDGPTATSLETLEIDGQFYNECPGRLINPETYQFLNLYNLVKLFQVLPNSGGLLDQSAKFMQAALKVETVIQENQQDKAHSY